MLPLWKDSLVERTELTLLLSSFVSAVSLLLPALEKPVVVVSIVLTRDESSISLFTFKCI
jgi:hypothetical protein